MLNPARLKFLFTLIMMITACHLYAQEPNPFKSIGKKADVLDISKGKYTEIIEKDSLERIGSVIINRHTRKIEKFIDEASLKKQLADNTKQSRFFSVDPIASKFAELSPYQYASNRPIDGIDLDGLEYLTVQVDITVKANGDVVLSSAVAEDFRYKSEEEMNKIHKTTDFYKKYSSGFGSRGKGVLYKYTINDERYGPEFREEFTKFFKKESFSEHGIYAGPGTSTYFGPIIADNKQFNPYNFKIMPNDEVDALSRIHDMQYDALTDYKGWVNDTKTIPYDIEFVEGLKKYILNSFIPGYTDKFTKRKPSKEAVTFALKAITLFENVIIYKQERLAKEKLGITKPADVINTTKQARRDIKKIRNLIPGKIYQKLKDMKRNAVQDKK